MCRIVRDFKHINTHQYKVEHIDNYQSGYIAFSRISMMSEIPKAQSRY